MSNKGKKLVKYYEFEIGKLPRKVARYERSKQGYSQLLPLFVVMFSIAVGAVSNSVSLVINQVSAQENELISPYVRHYESYNPNNLDRGAQFESFEVEALSSPSHQDYSHEEIVREVFGEKADEALKIMKCESGGRENNVGDTHIMVYDPKHDEMVGDSIGLFQVRTGGKEINGHIWNRARANGMTADEFRTYLKNPENNIRYAKDIYDNAGSWKPWFNCMNKVLSK